MTEDLDLSISKAIETWGGDSVAARLETAVRLREEFVDQFPLEAWPDLPVERYGLGTKVDGGSVCWWLEFRTRPVGSMSGGAASKHLIYRSNADGEWRFPKGYASLEEAWTAVRSGFVEAFRRAAEGHVEEADEVQALNGAGALRTKALFMYFPDQLLPITSKTDIDHFLRGMGDPASSWSTVRANQHLLEVARQRDGLKEMSTQELGFFLYHWLDPRPSRRVVTIAPGDRAEFWDDCLANGYICVGWDDVGDLSQFADKATFQDEFAGHYPYNGNASQVKKKSSELWTLIELKAGDKVIANRGVSEVLAVGTVTDEGYSWRPERDQNHHTVAVAWETAHAQQIDPVKNWGTTTVCPVPETLFHKITSGRSHATSVDTPAVFSEIEQALDRRGQVILYGPPGTGKTYIARRAAVWLLEGGSSNPEAAGVVADPARFQVAEQIHGGKGDRPSQTWFMVANPTQWSWTHLFDDGSINFSLGRLKRNYSRVRAGDLVVGYESAATGRITALARVATEFDPDGDPKEALVLEPVAKVKDGLSWKELNDDPILSKSEPLRFRCQGTLFALSPLEADRLLALLATRDKSIVPHASPAVTLLTRTTFHPSYTYEDFVEGYRPQPTSDGNFQLGLTDGMFKEVCLAAAADPGRRHVVLIDEINRGNVPKIFGELITLIEKDKRGLSVRLPQSGDEFTVPPNLYVIATMNTADRSIHLLDTALRRRFAFIELLPDSRAIGGASVGTLALDVFLDTLNEQIRQRVGRERQVGHAIFFEDGVPVDTAEAFASIFRHELLPLLQEYFYEDYTELEGLLGPEVIDVENERPSSLIDDGEALCAALAGQFDANVVA